MSGLEMKYFVLKPSGSNRYARASRVAMRAYARSISTENSELAVSLEEWANREQFLADNVMNDSSNGS